MTSAPPGEPRLRTDGAPADDLGLPSDPTGDSSADRFDLSLADSVTRREVATSLMILRNPRGWSQTRLGKAAGIHSSAVSTCETGKRLPHLQTVLRLLAALGYTLADFQATVAFLRAREPTARVPLAENLDLEAHRIAANLARAHYDSTYAMLASRRAREAPAAAALPPALPPTLPARAPLPALPAGMR
jgi:transcriptional regulator with XRE-family HTH domain